MADQTVTGLTGSIATASDEYYMKGADSMGKPAKATILLVEVASCNATLTLKARPRGSSATPVAIPYEKLYLNGSVADGSQASAGITDTSLIRVDITGIEIVFSASGWSQGSMTYDISVGTY